MPYGIEYTGRALKDLRKIDGRNNIVAASAGLANDPRPPKSTKLTNDGGYRRLTVHGYRVKYAVDDTKRLVTIARVGLRGEIYRKKYRG